MGSNVQIAIKLIQLLFMFTKFLLQLFQPSVVISMVSTSDVRNVIQGLVDDLLLHLLLLNPQTLVGTLTFGECVPVSKVSYGWIENGPAIRAA